MATLVITFRNNRPQFIATGVLGLALAALLAVLLLRADQVRERAAFRELAQQRVSQATEHLHDALQDLVSLRALFDSAGIVDRAQFDSFCAPLLASDPAIQALEWIPAVSASQRAQFEQRARADGFAHFSFTAHTAQGMRAEADKPQYFPVYYVSPYHGNEQALGFDLASNPARRAALMQAAASGSMVATSRIVLVQAQHAGYGFLVFYPVYRPGAPRAGSQPIGFVLGVFKVADIVRSYRAPTLRPVHLAVFDVTQHEAGEPGTVLYPRKAHSDFAALRDHDGTYQEVLDVGGRTWRVIAYQAPRHGGGTAAIIVFAAGALATLLILALMRQMMITRETEAAREVASRSDAAKSRFMANVSHEMRTPLNGVIGMLDLLMQSSLRPAQMRMAQVSRRSAVNLLGIINDLLDYSKMEAGRFEVMQEPVPIRRLLEEEFETFRNLGAKAGCALHLRIDDAMPDWIVGDDLRLRQVLNNLLSNAVKFSAGLPRPGRVELLAGVSDAEQIEIAIMDNGIGIDAATQARLFSPFEQGDLGTTKRYGGTGLGLTITRHLVELMGGSITLRSHPGRGSRFTVRLPMRVCVDHPASIAAEQPAQPQAVDEPAAQASTDAPRLRVLLAEDNETNQEVIRLQLARCGFAADIAGNGAQALELFRAGSYGLVLSDLHMPVLDGFGLARAIREFEREQRREPSTIIAVTAAAQETELRQAREAGMDGHLVKPVRLEQLRDMLQDWRLRHAPAVPEPVESDHVESGQVTPEPTAPEPTAPGQTAPGQTAPAGDDAAPGPDDAGSVDLDVLRGLVGDDSATLCELMTQFLGDLAGTAVDMAAASVRADWKALGDLAHRMKSSSRTLGAARLGDLCAKIETACKAGDADAAVRWLREFEQQAAVVRERLVVLREGLQRPGEALS